MIDGRQKSKTFWISGWVEIVGKRLFRIRKPGAISFLYLTVPEHRTIQSH